MHSTRLGTYLVLCFLVAVGAMAAARGAEEGRAKTDFALPDADGTTRRLSDYRGKWVVLEWVNFECTPVQELYEAPTRTMQTLQQTYMAKGVVWLSINSTAEGQRGHMTPAQSKSMLARLSARPTALLLDPAGRVGKLFGAKLTPEVRVLSPTGDVAYAGGVQSAGAGAPVRYLDQVLGAATTGQPLPFKAQSMRGCRIGYAAAAPAVEPAADPSASTATGPRAPDFALVDSSGATRRLSDFRGKWVVLEWVNYDCPYVQMQYQSPERSMQALQARCAQQGIVWLSICSSARGKEGYFSSTQANARKQRLGATPTAYLHDPTGAVGRSYGAKKTPDMRIISPQGTIEYAGGIDSSMGRRVPRGTRVQNYVALALADIAAGRPIGIQRSPPFGCSVKY